MHVGKGFARNNLWAVWEETGLFQHPRPIAIPHKAQTGDGPRRLSAASLLLLNFLAMSIHDLIPLITALAPYSWPVTIGLFALLFRSRIKDIVELKLGEKFYAKLVPYGGVPSDLVSDPAIGERTPRPATKQLNAPSGVKWENVANVFWLGADLTWTAQSALRGAPKETILHGLTQSYHHISELGLARSEPAKQLSLLKSETAILPETSLDRTWRAAFSEKVYEVTRMINNNMLVPHQPGFQSNPSSS